MEINEKIAKMETLLNQSQAQAEALEGVLATGCQQLEDLRALFDYYGSPEWREHYELDREGKIPAHIPRGVLSEDGIYNTILDYRDLAAEMRDLADQIDRVIDRED